MLSQEQVSAIESARSLWASAAVTAAVVAAEKRGLVRAADTLGPLLEAACRGYRLDYAPVGSVTGGLLAREVSKLVTLTDEPFWNIIGIDGLQLEGRVGRLPLRASDLEAEAAEVRAKLAATAGDAMSLDSSEDEDEDEDESEGGAGASKASAPSDAAGVNSGEQGGDDDDDDDIEIVEITGPQAAMES